MHLKRISSIKYWKWSMIHNIIDFHIGSHSLWENKKLFKKISLMNVFFKKKKFGNSLLETKHQVLQERTLKDACF